MKNTEINEDAKVYIKSLLNQRSQIDMAIRNYIEGLKAGKGLNGDYNFDTRSLSFSKIEKKEAE